MTTPWRYPICESCALWCGVETFAQPPTVDVCSCCGTTTSLARTCGGETLGAAILRRARSVSGCGPDSGARPGPSARPPHSQGPPWRAA